MAAGRTSRCTRAAGMMEHSVEGPSEEGAVRATSQRRFLRTEKRSVARRPGLTQRPPSLNLSNAYFTTARAAFSLSRLISSGISPRVSSPRRYTAWTDAAQQSLSAVQDAESDALLRRSGENFIILDVPLYDGSYSPMTMCVSVCSTPSSLCTLSRTNSPRALRSSSST